VFLNKSTKAMPYLNRPWKGERNWFLNVIWEQVRYIGLPENAQSEKRVDTCAFPIGIDETGRVISKQGNAEKTGDIWKKRK
jgi:dimethylaniline monooxygenase (N-oxide forming)